ncbi:mRNA cap guanine-N7 methyltransferase 2 isoform X2 [Cornus florida]|uniref:mRNA cap guanine-N7 methyltransferase 2 isoform X2 n=1 Tax=Cornus florida TaxID=4283 RepID=UPI00289A581A|nr:mRNA cap guanine-N7 methyltransferase 2 isoform X2 [Cornus florida]
MISVPSHRPTTDSIHYRLFDFAKTALIKIFVSPYATVCDLYCGRVSEADKWDEAQIGHYIGIDVASSGVSEVREAWESQRKTYSSKFFELDPSIENIELHLKERNTADIVCCLQHLQLCFETEERVRKLLHNVSSLLRPGGYFFGITPDSSTIWAKYQKNVEAYHNKSSSMKPNIVPNCIRSESYMITFEVEEEKFPFFGKKYQLKFSNDISAETHCLVHFPSLIRAQFAGMLLDAGLNLVDPRGRLLPRSYDVLGLYTTFIFQKPDPDICPPLMTPLLQDGSHNQDEMEWQGTVWRDDEKNGQTDPSHGLGKISEQKGILGPGPADLRFSEAL